jgi:stress response protein YsnF
MTEDHDEVAIPLVEERLITSKRVIETGRVKVTTVAEEQESLVREKLTRTVFDVERVAVNREVECAPPVREEGDSTIISVVQEVLVVTKKLVVTEELRIRRRQIIEEHTQPVTLRTQRAIVEREGSSGETSIATKE